MNRKQRTFFITKEQANAGLKWYLLDAHGKTLGRFASEVAKILQGKHKPIYTPNVDVGDGVIIINALQIQLTGNKEARKIYNHYTGRGMKETPYRTMKKKKPEYIIFHAVKGMMPKGKLGRKQLKKLYIFKDDKHNMQAQKPSQINI